MALRCELASDRERGPGHGLVNIAGLRGLAGEVDFTLQRNHGTDPFLGPNGRWQSAEYWHHASVRPGEAAGLDLVIPVGPELVDPIVEQPPNISYLLTVGLASAKQSGTLKIDRSLLGSKAAAPAQTAAPQGLAEKLPKEALTLPTVEETEQEQSKTQEDVVVPPPPSISARWKAFIGVSVLLLFCAVGAGLWWSCYLPVMSPEHCELEPEPEPEPKPEPEPEPQPEPEPEPEPEPQPDPGLPDACTNADNCLSLALKALEERRLEPARQLLQRASGLGSAKAGVHLAEMYDPATWSADKSPVDQPDWETASYWYEEAARQGEPNAMIAAGRLYCEHSSDPVFRDRGLSVLRKAAVAPGASAAVQQLLKTCEEKAQ